MRARSSSPLRSGGCSSVPAGPPPRPPAQRPADYTKAAPSVASPDTHRPLPHPEKARTTRLLALDFRLSLDLHLRTATSTTAGGVGPSELSEPTLVRPPDDTTARGGATSFVADSSKGRARRSAPTRTPARRPHRPSGAAPRPPRRRDGGGAGRASPAPVLDPPATQRLGDTTTSQCPPRLPRAPAPKSQTPTLVAPLLGDLGFPAPTEDQHEHSPR